MVPNLILTPRPAANSDTPPPPPGAATRRMPRTARPRRAPMSLALGVVLGGLVLLAVASVMGVGIWSGYRNTADLTGQKAEVGRLK